MPGAPFDPLAQSLLEKQVAMHEQPLQLGCPAGSHAVGSTAMCRQAMPSAPPFGQ